MLKSNSTVILNWQSRLINNYLSKGFFVIYWGSRQLNLIPNDVILRINMVDQMKTDYVMVKNESLSAIENTIKPLHINKICILHTNKTYIRLNRVKLMICFWNTLFLSWKIFNILFGWNNKYKIFMLLFLKKSTQRWEVAINK